VENPVAEANPYLTVNTTQRTTPYTTSLWGDIKNTMTGFQTEAEAAKQANISRYEDILGKYNTLTNQTSQTLGGVPDQYRNLADFYGGRTAEARQYIDQLGTTRRQELEDQRLRAAGALNARQGGLAGSYVHGLERGITSDYNRAKTGLEESLAAQRLGILGQYTKEEGQARQLVPQSVTATALQQQQIGEHPLQFMERREDIGPTLQDTLNYAQLVGTQTTPTYQDQRDVQKYQSELGKYALALQAQSDKWYLSKIAPQSGGGQFSSSSG
jgi:hypothetical protein